MRRGFIVGGVTLLLLSGCRKVVTPPTQAVFGTVCTVNAYSDGTEKLYGELSGRLDTLDREFSVSKTDSEISRINDAAGDHAVSVTADVLYVIKTALAYASATDGAFDPTIGPVVALWGINTDHARVPSREELEAALHVVDWRKVKVSDDGKVFLQEKGMRLDLGGIVKGYAADELVAILKKHSVKRAVIDLGGNIYAYGKKKDGSPWRVGVKNPEDPSGSPALVLNLQNSSIVTSGIYERFFIQDGIRYHHIIDPKTGYPADNGLTSVTIVCESSTAADALSTSLFILGPEKGFALLDKFASVGNAVVSGSAEDQTRDGMGAWLFDDTDAQNQTDSATTPYGTPVLAAVPGLTSSVSAVFIETDRKVIASKDLEPVLKVADSAYPAPVFH